MTQLNPFQRAASQTPNKPKTEWQGNPPYVAPDAPQPEALQEPQEPQEPQSFRIGNEVIRVSNQPHCPKIQIVGGKYDEMFSKVKEGQRIITEGKQQTDRIARAFFAYLKKQRGEFTIKTTHKYPDDGLGGVWYFSKKPKKAGTSV